MLGRRPRARQGRGAAAGQARVACRAGHRRPRPPWRRRRRSRSTRRPRCSCPAKASRSPPRRSARTARRSRSAGWSGSRSSPKSRPSTAPASSSRVAPGKSIVQATGGAGLMATVPVEVEQADFALVGGSEVLGPEEAETLHVAGALPGQPRAHRRGLQWRSADSAVATVGPTGVVQARQPGRTEIVLTAFGQERRTSLTVHRLPQVLVVTPKPPAEALQIPLRATRVVHRRGPGGGFHSDSRGAHRVGAGRHDEGVLRPRHRHPHGPRHRRHDAHGAPPRVRAGGLAAPHRARACSASTGPASASASESSVDARRRTCSTRRARSSRPASGVEWATRPARGRGGERRRGPRDEPGPRGRDRHAARGGKPATADVFVTADLLVASNRSGAFGLYQVRPDSPDTLLPVLVDGGGNVQGVRSPDRTRIAFSSNRAGSVRPLRHGRRRTRRRAASPSIAGSEGDPVWTPDGIAARLTPPRRAPARPR